MAKNRTPRQSSKGTERAGAEGEFAAQIRRLMRKPVKKKKGNAFVLTWMETDQTDDTGCRVMAWEPETPEEIAQATRFYEAACKLDETPDAIEARQGSPGKRLRSGLVRTCFHCDLIHPFLRIFKDFPGGGDTAYVFDLLRTRLAVIGAIGSFLFIRVHPRNPWSK